MHFSKWFNSLDKEKRVFVVLAAIVVAYAFFVRHKNAQSVLPSPANSSNPAEQSSINDALAQYATDTQGLTQQNSAIATMLSETAKGLSGQIAELGVNFANSLGDLGGNISSVRSDIQGAVTSLQNLPLLDAQYYQIGLQTTAVCMSPTGDVDMTCYYLHREFDSLPWCSPSDRSCHDGIVNSIRQKWGHHLKNGKWDFTAIGREASGGEAGFGNAGGGGTGQ